MEDTITITITKEIAKDLARVSLSPDDQVKLRIFQVREQIAEYEAQVKELKDELKELRK